jgi:DNA-binding CsgD family transcriptional regulator/tetratricopeptide (TPR) repeat protein
MPGPGERLQPAPIMGRDAALARLHGLVEPVPQASQVLVVIGEAGMGKTVLLAGAAGRARSAGMRVVSVTGRESESKLAFAGLHQLLRPVLSGAAGLPARQAQALLGALGLAADPVVPDPLLTGVAVLTLLSDLSEHSPVLVVADDAQWLDRSSLDALAFAGSRLDAERVVLLVGARGPAPPPGFDRGFPELHLEPLSAAGAGRLLDRQPRPPRGRARAQVLAQAAGNPMALIELAKVVADDPAASRRWAAEPLPPTDRLTAVLISRFAALPEQAQAALTPGPEDRARRLVAAASAAVPTGQGDWVQDLAGRALAVTADPGLRLTARGIAGWALAWSGRRTAALSALISVAEEASRDQPALAWDALGSAATVAYQSGKPASRQAVSRALGLLERQGPPPPGQAPGIDVNALRLWIRASADPIGSRNQLLPSLRKIADSPIEDPSLWRVGSAAWLLDESDLAVRLMQDAIQWLRAPGLRGTSGGGLTVLGWAYIDTGRWDEALEVAAEAAGTAEANQMDIVAASADVITATVHALRGDSGAARRHAARALAAVDPAECGLVAARARRALGVAALADGSYLQAFTQLRGLFSDDGTPLHNYASYLGVADLAAAAVRAGRRIEGCDVIEHALSRLGGRVSARLEQLIARARGILAEPAGSQAHFGTGLSDPAGDQWPFERAQLRLDYGEWLRRRRRINDAKPVLTQALETFRRLGAWSWAQRAEAELRACGVAVAGAAPKPDALGQLTPQQRQIVRLASDGLTDREIGDRLFLSPRTVSSHLYRSYPKLGVAGRHQLRDVIARASTPAPAHESDESRTLL